MEGLPDASRNRALDVDLSDVDFDDESTSDDVTDAPPTPNKSQVIDKRVRKFKANSTDNSAVSQLTNNVDDQLLSSIQYDETLKVSELEISSLRLENI